MAENLSMELDELQLKAVEESIKNGLFIPVSYTHLVAERSGAKRWESSAAVRSVS